MPTTTRARVRTLRPPAPWPFWPEAVVGDRYEVQELLGRGGLSVVYRARDLETERDVALKVLRSAPVGEVHLARFLREARVTARLHHPHVVQVHEAGVHRGWPFLALELLEGPSLELLLLTERRLDPRRTLRLLLPVVDALAHAHGQGVVHRDVKPGNVLLDAQGRPYLTDFGLALDGSDPRRITWPGQGVGTPAYVAPEQRRGEEVDARSDVYALGVTLYECLTGTVPAALRPSPPEAGLERLAPDASALLRELVLRCLAHDPAARLADAGQVARVLRAAHGVRPSHGRARRTSDLRARG